MLGEVQGAEAGGFRTEDGASPGAALAGEDAGVIFACELLVHSIEEADFAAAYAHVACRDILIGAYALPQLEHKGLAEAHYLGVALAHGVKVAAALGAAHREGGEGVLEGLLEAEELEHRRGHCLVETKTSLVGAYGAVELDAIAGIGLDLACVVDPGDAEGEYAVRLNYPFHYLGSLEFGVLVVDILDRLENLLHCLQILFLQWILGLEFRHYCFGFHN